MTEVSSAKYKGGGIAGLDCSGLQRTCIVESQLAGCSYLAPLHCWDWCWLINIKHLTMEFSSNQEDIYNKLVATTNKYGKETQVKYELTRPRKKQKKKKEETDARLEIVNEQLRADDVKVDEDAIYDTAMDGDTSDDDELEGQEPPPPPPRVDSLQPAFTPTTTPAPPSQGRAGEAEEENLYEPRHWRQQTYESWTPGYVFPPPPSQPPPKPPLSQERREQSYEVWTPAFRQEPREQREPSPPLEAPPQPPSGPSEIKKSKLFSEPKQLKGVKGVKAALKPVRPAPLPPVTPVTPVTPVAPQSPESPEEKIRLSAMKESLPDPETERLYEPCNWRRVVKTECEEEVYGALEDILPPPPSPEALGGSLTFARAPLRKSKSILKEKKSGEEKKAEKRVRMLFPEDTVTPI